MNTQANDVQEDTTHVGARVPTPLAERLAQIAKREDRSVSAELRRALERHVRESEKTMA